MKAYLVVLFSIGILNSIGYMYDSANYGDGSKFALSALGLLLKALGLIFVCII